MDQLNNASGKMFSSLNNYKYFYNQSNSNLPVSNIHASTNVINHEILYCKEFKPSIIKALDLLKLCKAIATVGMNLGGITQENNTTKDQSYFTAFTTGVSEFKKHVQDVINTTEIKKTIINSGQRQSKETGLDMLYHLPLYFYKNLVSGVYGRAFTIPIPTDFSHYLHSTSIGQFKVHDSVILEKIQGVIDKILGSFPALGIPTSITWDGSNDKTKISYNIKLYNKNTLTLLRNIDFINNIIAGNMWSQNGIVKYPSTLYDVAIPSRNIRLFYCEGGFTCNYEGKLRIKTLYDDMINISPIANTNPGNMKNDVNNYSSTTSDSVKKDTQDLSAFYDKSNYGSSVASDPKNTFNPNLANVRGKEYFKTDNYNQLILHTIKEVSYQAIEKEEKSLEPPTKPEFWEALGKSVGDAALKPLKQLKDDFLDPFTKFRSNTDLSDYQKLRIANRRAESNNTSIASQRLDAAAQSYSIKATGQVILNPTITHIPDIFNFSLEFTSLLPNNFNMYLYGIENKYPNWYNNDAVSCGAEKYDKYAELISGIDNPNNTK